MPLPLLAPGGETMDLTEWTLTYVKNKDLLQRKLQHHTKKGNTLTFHYKDRVHDYVIQETLSDCTRHKTGAPHLTFVCPATPPNLNYILKNWKEIIQHKNHSLLLNGRLCSVNIGILQ